MRLRKDRDIKPSFSVRPFDTPFYLRTMYKQEIKNCLDAGQIVLCGTEPSQWASKAFPVLKGDGTAIRNVSDFKRSNQAIEKLNRPAESATELLRHIDPEARFFVSLDLTSGYHQIRIEGESQNLLCMVSWNFFDCLQVELVVIHKNSQHFVNRFFFQFCKPIVAFAKLDFVC